MNPFGAESQASDGIFRALRLRMHDVRRPSSAEADSLADWISVSRARPCRVCGGKADCRFHYQELFASCTRCQSDWPLTSGDWLHRTDRECQDVLYRMTAGGPA
jgi:hypothetical protein